MCRFIKFAKKNSHKNLWSKAEKNVQKQEERTSRGTKRKPVIKTRKTSPSNHLTFEATTGWTSYHNRLLSLQMVDVAPVNQSGCKRDFSDTLRHSDTLHKTRLHAGYEAYLNLRWVSERSFPRLNNPVLSLSMHIGKQNMQSAFSDFSPVKYRSGCGRVFCSYSYKW